MFAFGSINDGLSYWKVELTSGRILTENERVLDLSRGGYRYVDWAFDLNTTGDILRIKKLYLCKGTEELACLPIEEPGTAFQFKQRYVDILGNNILEGQCIGKVTDKEEGTCECYIYDRFKGLISYTSTVRNFGTWREGLIPLKELSLEVSGLKLS